MRQSAMLYGRFESNRSLPRVCKAIARVLSGHFDVSIWSVDSPWAFPDRLPQSDELFRVGHMAAHRTKMYEGTHGAAIELRARKDIPATFFGYPDQIMAGWMRYHLRRYPGFVCESMDLLQQWREEANRHTAIWVPSRFCYDVFKQARVAVPIHVIRHGVEPEFRPLHLQKPGPMTFLLLNTVGHFSYRKGILEGMRAFHDAFSHGEDVRLLLRSPADDAIEEQWTALADKRIMLQVPNGPSIDAERMNWLYNKVHVYFSPSRGEGFGLPGLEAKAAGIPVVMTAWHGAREHLQKDLDIEIPPAKGLCGIPISEEEIGMAYDLDHDAMVAALRQAYAEYDNRSAMSLAAAPRISREWAWGRVLEPLVQLLKNGTVAASRAP